MNRIMKNFVSAEKVQNGYWLIKEKMCGDDIDIRMFNFFDIIDYWTFDLGTGQIMLKESDFYTKYKKGDAIIHLSDRFVIPKIKKLYLDKCKDHFDKKKRERESRYKRMG